MKRMQHFAPCNAQVALEALKGQRPVHEWAFRDRAHAAPITRGTPHLAAGRDEIGSRGPYTRVREVEALRARLDPEIGPLKGERD
jgi:hypothetical protein